MLGAEAEDFEKFKIQMDYTEVWRKIDPEAEISIEPTIEGALNLARRIGLQHDGMQTLVTGSLHLVGAALHLLESDCSSI